MIMVLPRTAVSVISSGTVAEVESVDPDRAALAREQDVVALEGLGQPQGLLDGSRPGCSARAPWASAAHIVVVARRMSMTNTVRPCTSICDSPPV